MNMETLQYPIGRFHYPNDVDEKQLALFKETIHAFPEDITRALNGLSKEALSWTYRPKGWNIIQLVHHCADSHINSLIRFKWTLTENKPTIKTYNEADWSKLIDGNSIDLEPSLQILKGIHQRWSLLLNAFGEDEWKRKLIHPEMKKTINLAQLAAQYSWHCTHHLAHINLAKESKGKYNV